ncbi:unnamed protein product [Mytilus edulis]|uniref:Uncharacterized protein n=1 Tax=Mytilus edulis TaxID=6550 RepID=A0A8S3R9Y0_MYTED|nr:unnamed protein product [Mytilus edulis]
MAEAWYPNFIGEDNPITCIKCFLSFEPPSWLKVPINQYLLSISDTIGGFEYSSDYYFDTARVPFQFYCPKFKCNHNNITVAEVSADAVWNHDEIMEGRAPRIMNFCDIRIITVSPLIGISTSLRESFKFGCEYDIEHVEDITSNLTYDPNRLVVFGLRIIAKTTMEGGFCYLALDQSNGRILRPVFNISDGLCCWPNKTIELEVGHLYNFRVIAHPDDQSIQRNYMPFPHKNEDIIVTGFVEELSSFQPLLTQLPLKSLLLSLARLDIQDIFGPCVIKKHHYVDENTPCKSAGILRSNASVKYNNSREKYYCKVKCRSGTYSMPVKAKDILGNCIYSDALIILGLGRPFAGGKRWYPKYSPARSFYLLSEYIHYHNRMVNLSTRHSRNLFLSSMTDLEIISGDQEERKII